MQVGRKFEPKEPKGSRIKCNIRQGEIRNNNNDKCLVMIGKQGTCLLRQNKYAITTWVDMLAAYETIYKYI